MTWRALPISLTELCIDKTLRCGQSFRWTKSAPDTFSCAIHGRLISLRQDSKNLYYRALRPTPVPRSLSSDEKNAPPTPPSSTSAKIKYEEEELEDTKIETEDEITDGKEESEEEALETEAFLRHYLNLGPNLGELYENWSAADANFAKRAPRFTGIRILRQDAWEALVGFICSSNNNIARISQMMHKLSQTYGPQIATLNSQSYFDLPPPSALTHPSVEGQLRTLGFGYRAKYVHQTALLLSLQPEGWLDSLRNPESPLFGHAAGQGGAMGPSGREGYRAAHAALLSLRGVGPKVADCVCLMGLGWGEAVPVDTHVWGIAQRDYRFGGRGKGKSGGGGGNGNGKGASLTKEMYGAVGDLFRRLWGNEAGWAHSVLFAADLRTFSAGKEEEGVRVEGKVEEKVEGEREIKVEEVKVEVEDGEEGVGLLTPKETPARARKVKVEKKRVLEETVKLATPESLTGKRTRASKVESEEGREEKRPRFGTRWSTRRKSSRD
ncbi:8-oxoguanine glycosylase ogg1 [Thelotrema lepadinum]|nr:8-oxoguanine glycosylase ogg1 [Thelotrema lepadinum]